MAAGARRSSPVLLYQQRYRCRGCGAQWMQLRWDGGRPEVFCVRCGRPTAEMSEDDADPGEPPPEVMAGIDALCWSDRWRTENVER